MATPGKHRGMGERRWAAQGLECQGLSLGRVEQVGGVGKQSMQTHRAHVCVCARARQPVCIRVPGCIRTWDLELLGGHLVEEVWGWGIGNLCGGRWGISGHIAVVAEALVRTLASYEVVTPARVNEFGEVFPQSHHFSRRKRSSETLESTPFRTHYRISAYGQLFQLNLTADAAFLAAGYTEVHLGAPAPGAEEGSAAPPDLRHCFYRGQVNAREDHTAVFSLCGGLVSALGSFGIFLEYCRELLSGRVQWAFPTWWLVT